MKHTVVALGVLLVIVGATVVLHAKGPTTKITIATSGQHKVIAITDREVLERFHVWSGPGTFANGVEGEHGFIIDWRAGAVTDRPSGLPRYEVSFYVRYANRPFDEQTDRLAYIVFFELDSATGKGYVYLPGRHDDHYRLNTKAIYHGREGHWFHATSGWQNTFVQLVRD